MNIIKDLEFRYAVKKFDSEKKITLETIEQIEKGLILSASSFGLQPWKFIFISRQSIKEKILPIAFQQSQVVDCSHLVVFCRKNSFGETEIDEFLQDIIKKRNLEEDNPKVKGYGDIMKKSLLPLPEEKVNLWQEKQIYIALGNLLTICASMKVDSCPMEGFLPKELDKLLELEKQNLSSVVMCPIGYRSAEDTYVNLPKVRFDSKKVIIRIDE